MKELMLALSAFQKECPQIKRETEAKGAKFSYKYASLDQIYAVAQPLLIKHKLVVTQLINGEKSDSLRLKTVLFHTESGEQIEMETPIPDVNFQNMNKYQSVGAGISYFRRYTFSSILGIVTEEDIDVSDDEKPAHVQFEETESEKPWLNPGSEQWLQAIKYLNEGGTIERISEKYRMSRKNRELLLSESI